MTTPLRPRGVVDLRGTAAAAGRPVLAFGRDAAVIVCGLPGSGKSTLLRRWSAAARRADPRDTRLDCTAAMPSWLPYAVYRPWSRLRHLRRTLGALADPGPLLIHDCGTRRALLRLLARRAVRRGRELHLVVLDVGGATALAGQRERGRHAPRRVFARHLRGMERLLLGLAAADGPAAVPAVPGAVSAVLLCGESRAHAAAVFE